MTEEKLANLQSRSGKAVSEFEELAVLKGNKHSENIYHEDSPAFQKKSSKHFDNLSKEFEQLRNLFIVDNSKELI